MAETEIDTKNGDLDPQADADILLDDPIIDLRDPEATWDHVSRDLNPFERMSKQQTKRLMVQVLCELVAFGELGEDGEVKDKDEAKPLPAAGIPVGGSGSTSD